MQTAKTRILTESAAMIAIASLLSLINFTPLPWGGGITPASMLPIVVLSYRRGVRTGIFSGLVFGIVNVFTGFHTVSAMFLPGENQLMLPLAILSLFLDYLLAYSAVGLAGIFRRRKTAPTALALGSALALGIRYLMHFLSGFVIYGEWAEWFFSQTGRFGEWFLLRFSGTGLAAVYSLIYNGTYMIPEIIITSILAFLIGKIKVIADASV